MKNSTGFFQIGPIKAWFHKSGGCKRRRLFLIIPAAIILVIGLFIGLGHLLAWLWRETVSDIFGVRPISFWQAWDCCSSARSSSSITSPTISIIGPGRRQGRPDDKS